MSTFWQVLRIAFWVNPLQRVLTCIGAVIMVVGLILATPFGLPGSTLPLPFLGVFFISAASVLVGGVYLRLVSAPRIVRLAPRGRPRLLFSAIGLIMLIALLWMSQYWLFFLRWVDPKFYPSLASQLVGIADSAAVTSTALVGLFIASRSPFAALLVIFVLFTPGLAAKLLDVDLRQLNGLRGSLSTLALIWIPFSVWYLNVRRISAPGWLARDDQDVLATTLISATRPKSRQEALERLLLGGTTVVRFGIQWFLVLALLLGMQWALSRVGDPSEPVLVIRVMLASLCIVPIVTTVVGFAVIRRSRAIWLLSDSSRDESFRRIDRTLIRLNLVMALVCGCWLVVLWLAQQNQPDPSQFLMTEAYFQLLALWVAGLFAISTQLAGWPKWPVAVLAATVLFYAWWVTNEPADRVGLNDATQVMAAVGLVIGLTMATVALRWLAQRRWCNGDLPRSFTSVAS